MRRRHLLVTGALGHIGSALIRDTDFLIDIERITLIDDLSTQRFCSLFDLPNSISYKFVEGDVGKVLSQALLRDVDVVVHLAGTVDPVLNFKSPKILQQNNIRITAHVAQMCKEAQVPLIFSSSTSVYTPSKDEVDETETELHPQGAYAYSKLEEEMLIRKEMSGGQYLIFRFGSIFGPSIGMRFQTAINKFCLQVALDEPIEVWRTAMQQLRPYLAISDCTANIGRAVSFKSLPNVTVNAVTCNATVEEILGCIRMCGIEPKVTQTDNPAMNSYSYRVSTEMALKLGFEFKGSLFSGIRETLKLLNGISQIGTRVK